MDNFNVHKYLRESYLREEEVEQFEDDLALAGDALADEIEDELCMFFDNKNDAIDEAGDYGVDIIIDKGYKATNKLKQMSLQKSIGIDNTFDILLTVYLDNNTEYDGIWWEEELDVLKYSAPRGVIFNSKLKTWDIKKID